jgi:hypothetical protein
LRLLWDRAALKGCSRAQVDAAGGAALSALSMLLSSSLSALLLL